MSEHYNTGGAQVWQYDGTTWTNVTPAWAAANTEALSMAVYGANLYVGTVNSSGGAQVWQYNGTAWTNVTPELGCRGHPLQALPCTEPISMSERLILPRGRRSGSMMGLPGPMLPRVGLLRTQQL